MKDQYKILFSKSVGEEWIKLVVQVGEDILLVQVHKDKWNLLDNSKNPQLITLSSENAFKSQQLSGSFFNGLWISKN